jgi:hypothetical protein
MTRSELSILRERWESIDPDEETRERVRPRLVGRFAKPQLTLSSPEAKKFIRRPLNRRMIVAAAFLLVAAATTAFSFGVHLPKIDFWSSGKVDHNSRIYRDFATLDVGAPAGMASGVVPAETRKVATIDGATLWVAPTRDGGFCTLFGHTGGCDRTGTVPLDATFEAAEATPQSVPRSGKMSPANARGGRSPQKTPAGGIAASTVSGYVNGRWSDELELRFADGTRVRPPLVWVSKPIDAGFFFYRTTAAQRQPGHELNSVVARTDNGTVISTQSLEPTREQSPPEDAVADQARDVAKIATRDGTAVLRRAPTRYDGRCAWLDFGARHYDVGPCLPANYARDGFEWRFVHSADDVVLVGAVPPSYALVNIRYADGTAARVTPIADGLDSWILFQIPLQHLQRSTEVTAVSAVTVDGRQVATEPLPPALLQQPCYGPLPIADPNRCP